MTQRFRSIRLRSAPLLLICGLVLAALPAAAQPTADQIAGQVLEALGGKEAWDQTRFIRFSFAGRRTHHWDKWTGRHRLEGQTPEGKPYVVLSNLNTKEGGAWIDGQKAEGDQKKEWLERAYGAWINDTYWLLMPYKLRDPGVRLSLAGEEKQDGKTWDKLLLSFDKVGLTPKDRYWVYVNRESGLVDRWDYILKGEAKPPSTFTWEGWKAYGRIKLPNDHVSAKDKVRIHHPVLDAPASVEDSTFTNP